MPEDFIDRTVNFICANSTESILRSFAYLNESMTNKIIAKRQCEKFCGANRKCLSCNFHCDDGCQWIAHTHCNKTIKSEIPHEMELSIKPGRSYNFVALLFFKLLKLMILIFMTINNFKGINSFSNCSLYEYCTESWKFAQ